MTHLPSLTKDPTGRPLELDAHSQIAPVILALAEAFTDDPATIGGQLELITALGRNAEDERPMDGLGHSEHARDSVMEDLLRDLGGTSLPLPTEATPYTVGCLRSIAFEAKRIAAALEARAEELNGQRHAATAA